MKIKDVIGTKDEESKIEKIYKKMPSGNTEEVTKHIFKDSYIIVLPFKWLDLGTWDSVYQFFANSDEPYLDGENILAIDSKRSLIKSDSKNKLIAAIGLEDFIIVDKEDVLLILPRDKANSLSKVRDQIKKHKELKKFL